MDKFIVSARKYRPQNFSTVVGQSHITTTLKNAIRNNQLAHAFLFCGPRGVGKTTCARILAKTINCENRTEDVEACNTCNSCVSFDQGTSLNIHELDAASNNSVDDIRSLVEQVRFAPQAGKYKVYIVDEVHMLSAAAFNAFLKTLEEPPPYAIFILATTEKHKILPTILSRCQIFDFKRITNQDTVEHLQDICSKESITADKTALHLIAQKSEGCLRDSLSILDKIVSFTNGSLTYSNTLEHLNILDEEYYFKLLSFMQTQQVGDAILMYDEINRKGFEGDIVLNGFSEFLRNVLVCQNPKVASLLEVPEDFKPRYLSAAKTTSTSWIISALNLLNDAEINYRQAKNKRLHVEMTFIKLCYLQQVLQVSGDSPYSAAEGTKAVAFKTIAPILLKTKTPALKPLQPVARLIIETEVAAPVVQNVVAEEAKKMQKEEAKPVSTGGRLKKLDKLREELNIKKRDEQPAKPLTDEEIYVAWGLFIEKLREKNKPSSVTNFKAALLKPLDEGCIAITVSSNFQQKFIETERAELVDHLQGYFNNKLLKYTIEVVEQDADEPKDAPLNSKEQYLKMIEQYPLVKELKDRLRLELDY